MNKRGFTLIEVIVTIIIIAILSGVGVVGFQTFFKTGEDRYYDALESDILLASNDYFTDHRDLLPTSGTYGEVSLSDLIKEKYIEEIKDAKGNVCTEGEVYVYRENNKYVYEPCIDCGGYKSKGIKYCHNENSEALKSEITITAVTSVTNTPWDVNVSYNAAKAVNNENVNVYFRSDNYLISSYEIVNTASGDKSSCDLGSESSCFIPISESGTYKVTAYGNKGNGREALVTNKYISVKISRSAPEYSVTGDRKYIINKNECNNNITKKTVELTIVKDNANVEVGKIKYKINNGEEEVVDNGLTISKELESGHYVFEITVEDFSGAALPPTTVAVDVAYLIDIEYDDDHSTGTHEVVKGQNYNFLSALPMTKEAFGKSLDIRWHLNGERIYPENIVENSCTYKIIGKMSIPVQVEDFTKYCESVTYNGSSQSLTKTPPANVTFKKSDKTSAEGINAGEYNLIAVINTPTYIWQDGDNFDFEDKPFKCSIARVPGSFTCTDMTYSGSSQVACSCTGGTLSGTYEETVVGTYTATCTPDGNHTIDGSEEPVTKTWEMKKAASSVTCKTVDYNGNSQNLVDSGSNCASYSNNNQTNAGEYTVTCNGDDNHENSTCTGKINKIDASLSCDNKTWNGNSQTIATCTGGTLSNQTRTEAGSQTVTCTGDANHNTVTDSCSIAKAASSVTCKTVNYNGNSQDLVDSGSYCASYSNNTRTTAGSQTVTCNGDDNHENSTCTGTINKVNAALSCANKTWNGNSQTIATCTGGTLSNHTRTAAGSQTVTCNGDDNHNTVTASCSITKAASSVSCKTLNYNGTSQNLVNSGSYCASYSNNTRTAAGSQTVTCNGDANHNNSTCTGTINKVNASLSCANKTWNGGSQTIATCSGGTLSNHTRTAAGSQTVTCTGDANHNTVTASCSITKAASSVKCKTVNYNGNSQNLVDSGSYCASYSNNNKKDPGSYTVTCNGDGNHNNSTCTGKIKDCTWQRTGAWYGNVTYSNVSIGARCPTPDSTAYISGCGNYRVCAINGSYNCTYYTANECANRGGQYVFSYVSLKCTCG